MDSEILIIPYTVLIANKPDKVLLTIEGGPIAEKAWMDLETKVKKIAEAFPGNLTSPQLETLESLNRKFIKVFSNVALGSGLAENEDAYKDLAENLEANLLIDGYTVKRVSPPPEPTVRLRKAKGSPVIAKIQIEDDCITISAEKVMVADQELNLNPYDVMDDIGKALEISKDLIFKITTPSSIEAIIKKANLSGDNAKNLRKAIKVREDGLIDGPNVHKLLEFPKNVLEPEDLIVAARLAAKYLEGMCYQVSIFRLIQTVETISF